MKREDLQPNTAVRGLLTDGPATDVSLQWHGANAITVLFRDSAGRVAEEIVYREGESRLEVVESGSPWIFDGDGALFRGHDTSDCADRCVRVSMETEADNPAGAPDYIVRTFPRTAAR